MTGICAHLISIVVARGLGPVQKMHLLHKRCLLLPVFNRVLQQDALAVKVFLLNQFAGA